MSLIIKKFGSYFNIFALLIVFNIASPVMNAGVMVSEPNEFWIAWDSKEGLKRQRLSTVKSHYMKLLRFYESQIRPTYCGIATAVVLLNSLSIEPPKSKILGKFRLFNQEEFFDGAIGEVVDKDTAVSYGLSLNDMAKVMSTQDLKVEKFEALTMSEDEIRSKLIDSLLESEKGVLVLYHRGEIKQLGAGHWSPLAAYDVGSDSFLILDVARFKYPPVWVDASALIRAMSTVDGDESRGFIVLEPKE
jgi:hypothetical protein